VLIIYIIKPYTLKCSSYTISGFQFGNKYTVVLSSPATIREALKDNEDKTASRFVPDSMKIVTQGVGVALQPDLER